MNQIQTNNHTQSHTINTNPHQNTQNTYHDSINSHTTISATTSQRAESNPLELKQIGLYESSFEHDACGIGAVANIKGERSYQVISSALNILMQLSIAVVRVLRIIQAMARGFLSKSRMSFLKPKI